MAITLYLLLSFKPHWLISSQAFHVFSHIFTVFLGIICGVFGASMAFMKHNCCTRKKKISLFILKSWDQLKKLRDFHCCQWTHQIFSINWLRVVLAMLDLSPEICNSPMEIIEITMTFIIQLGMRDHVKLDNGSEGCYIQTKA